MEAFKTGNNGFLSSSRQGKYLLTGSKFHYFIFVFIKWYSLFVIQDESDIKEHMIARRNKLSDFGLTDQPCAVIIGKTLDTIENCYIFIANHKFKVEPPLRCMDITFKAQHALHACYPPKREQLWLFLQRAVYKFRTKWDSQFERVDFLESEYNSFTM